MKWLRRIGWGVAGVLVLWTAAWLAVPPLLKSQAQQRLSDLLGRAVTIGDVSFSPWSMELTVRDIVIGGAPAVATPAAAAAASAVPPLLKVARLYVNADIRSLWKLAPVVEAFELDAPELRLTHTSPGHYDIDDVIARFASPPSNEPPGEPVHFAVYNIKVSDASVAFDDRPKDRQHHLTSLQLSLPFITNLPDEVDVKVEPRLTFRFNDTAFDTGAQATPFASTRAALLKFSMGDLDLTPYTVYLPESLPVRLRSGSVAAQIEVNFAMPPGAVPHVGLSGQVGLDKFALDDAAGAPLVAWKHLGVALRDVRPLDHQLALGAIELDAPTLHVSRDARGRLNFAQLAGSGPKGAVAPAAAAPVVGAVAASGASAAARAAPLAAPAAAPWKVAVESLHVGGLRVLWNDASVKPAAALALADVDFKAGPLAYPFAADATLPVSLKATLASQAEGAAALAQLGVDGRVSDRTAALELKLGELSLDALAPYVADVLSAKVSGRLSTSGQLNWAAGAPAPAATAASGAAPADTPAELTLAKGELFVDGLRITDGHKLPAVALKQFALRGVEVDVPAHTAVLGSVRFEQPAVAVARDRDGQWNVQQWLRAKDAKAVAPAAVAPATAVAASPMVAKSPAASAEAPWRVDLRDLALDGGSVRLDDAQVSPSQPVLLVLRGMKLGVQKLLLSGSRTLSPADVQFSARLAGSSDVVRSLDKSIKSAAGSATAGALDWRGQFGLQPLMVKGALKLDRLPVHAFAPYARASMPLDLVRAEAGVKADVAVRELPAGLDIGVAGDVLIADVLMNSRAPADAPAGASHELLSWHSFKLNGVKLAMAPAKPTRVDIAEVVLSDFFASLVLDEKGRFNLQQEPAADAPAVAAAPPVVIAAPTAPAASAEPAAATTATLPPEISVGATRLVNGRVDFTDHFVRPNYSADLSELNGSLSAFRSGSSEMATIELHGRAAKTALLEISGQFNPTAQPLALNIHARATDLELAPLSPYAGKYAGYAIERGKLSMDLSYLITPEGQLEAKNQVIVNQLTFGERVESASATSLPVLLAVSLLKDSNGVIDINLPISGSLKDPQFSIGGLVVKVIVNVLTKALTAPFSLLFGSSEQDLSVVEFTPGTAALSASGASALDKVAKALSDRPALKMTVTGASDLPAEREAYLQAAVDARLHQERAKELARDGKAPEPAAAGAPAEAFSAAERERLLKAVYKQTEIADKPRNFVGLAKDIPAAEMEALLKTVIPVTDTVMRQLALQRGLAVRDGLIAKGLSSDRLFIGAPKPRLAGADNAPWTPSAQLVLRNN
jgi:hypothetical protein